MSEKKEYIERKALIAKEEIIVTDTGREVCVIRTCNINAIPAADVEPVVYTERKEKTYHFDGEYHVGVVCSKCDASQFDGLGNARRCYNCGAHFGAHGKERER